MGKTSEEKYGKNYDKIMETAKKRQDLYKLLLMSKIYKSQASLDLTLDVKLLEKCKKLMNKSNKKNIRQNIKEVMKILVDENKKKGLRVPTASAFLHFLTNGKVPILDRYSYAVYKNKSVKKPKKHQKYKVENYMDFYDFYLNYRKSHGNGTPREINFKLMEDGKKIVKSIYEPQTKRSVQAEKS